MPTFSLADLQARVYARLDGNTILYTAAEVTDAINEAQIISNIILGYNQSAAEISTTTWANRHWYDVPDSIAVPSRVQFEGRYLQPIGIKGIGRAHPNWTAETTTNTGHPVSMWVRYGLNKFALWPADGVGGGQVIVSGVVDPPPLVNLTDTVDWNTEVVNCFDFYTSHILQLKESDAIFQQGSLDYVTWQQTVKNITYVQGWKAPRYWVDQMKQSVDS